MEAVGRRSLRVGALVVGSWLGLFVAFNVLILLVGWGARLGGKDPALKEDDWPDITHLRRVDEKLLVGGQTSTEDYRELAEHGVTTVLDVREPDGRGHKERDDPEALAKLGLKYVSVPIPDGRAPTPNQIRRVLDAIDEADGPVFAHCGGGVGRSTSVAAAYEASKGQDPSVLEQLAIGPPTLEQIWYVGTLRPDHPEHSINPAIAVASRVIDSPRTVYGIVTGWL